VSEIRMPDRANQAQSDDVSYSHKFRGALRRGSAGRHDLEFD